MQQFSPAYPVQPIYRPYVQSTGSGVYFKQNEIPAERTAANTTEPQNSIDTSKTEKVEKTEKGKTAEQAKNAEKTEKIEPTAKPISIESTELPAPMAEILAINATAKDQN